MLFVVHQPSIDAFFHLYHHQASIDSFFHLYHHLYHHQASIDSFFHLYHHQASIDSFFHLYHHQASIDPFFHLYHHQASIDPFFNLNYKMFVGQSCLKICLIVRYWMVFYERPIHLYDTVTNPWQQRGWYVPDSNTSLVIMSLSLCPLTPVFRSRLSTSAAALAPAHLFTSPRGPGLEVTHPVPGLLSHCFGSPALHGWTAASEACLLALRLAMRTCFGGPGAIEALVGWD